MNRNEAVEAVLKAKSDKDYTWEYIAKKLEMSPVWVTSACLGQNSMPREYSDKLCSILGLSKEVSLSLQQVPSRNTDNISPSDPVIYRFHEIIQVYGQTLKELIKEKFGDGIMSAIDFTMDVDKVQDPKGEGDRVQITMTGKFLSYKKW